MKKGGEGNEISLPPCLFIVSGGEYNKGMQI